jgi:acyl-CoA synthetase (AMP-forming)/AMP-acid ligase II
MMLLEMAVSGMPDRIALGRTSGGLTYQEVFDRAGAGAAYLKGAGHLAYVGTNDETFPVSLFAAAWAGVPFLPLNYRLGREQLGQLLASHEDTVIVADDSSQELVSGLGRELLSRKDWREVTTSGKTADPWDDDDEAVAVLLYTSGTTSAPKAVMLRHRHLTSYVIGSVEFAAAEETDATLVSVPPYHIAGVAAVLSNLYAGRRMVYLPAFDPRVWLDNVRGEGITNAMVVPTMLARVVELLGDGVNAETPTLRSLAYGGARMPVTVLERALRAFPDTNFVNAYGLTETSSTIAVLGPEDHKRAMDPDDEVARGRLSSVGQLVPGIEVEIRSPEGEPLPAGEEGEIFVRGEQVSGEYLKQGSGLDANGWFATRDHGWVDDEGYLFIAGRADDTIIRGGENIAPAEIEDVLLKHPAVAEAAVVGVPDDEWGQRLAAAVVIREGHEDLTPDGLRAFCREHLRSSKTPDEIVFRPELPHTDTGKLLRRKVLDDLVGG